jgi:VWFA-related protein
MHGKRKSLALVLCGVICGMCAHASAQRTKEPEEPLFKLQVSVNKVLVPVVVRDRQHRVVGNLKKEDFQVLDKDKLQVISGFSIENRGVAQARPDGGQPSSAPPSTPSPPSAAPRRFIVFLFDDLHLGADNLGQIQKLGSKMLDTSLRGSDMGAVVSVSGANSGLTQDRVQLEEAMLKLKSHPLYQHQDRQCPNLDYYEANLIENKHDGTAFEAAVQQTLACANLDPQTMRNVAESMVRSAATSAVTAGDQDVRVTLTAVKEFVKKMGTLPGQRTLILVSPGFVTLTPESMRWKTEILDLAAESDVTISALDARGLYSTELGASERGPDSQMAMQTGYESQSHRESVALNEDVMAELADGSGGTFFHNNNDLEAGFKELGAMPEIVYMLELSLDQVKADSTYHRLRVKVAGGDFEVRARRGYYAPIREKDQPTNESLKETEKEVAQQPLKEETKAVAKEPEKAAAKDVPKEVANDKPDAVIAEPTSGPATPTPSPAAETKGSAKHSSNRNLQWAPPMVDMPLGTGASLRPCVLAEILEQAGTRASELFTSLQSFSAQEDIEYQSTDHMGYLQDARIGTFDYLVLFQQTPGGTNVQESRQPKHGSRLLPVFTQDVGLPEMALMFLPEIQADYEMGCEGTTEWNGQLAYVVRFVNRKDRPAHTLSFRDSKGAVYLARLKGRAWIAADSGEVLHLESSLTDEMPKVKVRHWYLSIDYAPVRFHTQNVRMLLPQIVDAYCDFEDHRTIVYHAFSYFKLFSVQSN